MPSKNADMNGEDEVMRRCRRVRQELYARFKTPDEMFAWLRETEKQAPIRRGVKTAKAPTRRKATRLSAVKRRVKAAPAFKAHTPSTKKTARSA